MSFALSLQSSDQWSIGVYKLTYTDSHGFKLNEIPGVRNPVLSSKDITDRTAKFVADPFITKENNKFYIFFEIKEPAKETIGLAESSDGINWVYKGSIIEEPFHLAYPAIFKYKDTYYMTPDCHSTNSVRLYKAIKFPSKWEFVKTIAEGKQFVDPTIFFNDNLWWMVASVKNNKDLYLYWAKNVEESWFAHNNNPVIFNNPSEARPGGMILRFKDKIFRVAQNNYLIYGNNLRFFRILDISTYSYSESEQINSCFIEKRDKWQQNGIHTLNAYPVAENEWLACIDGNYLNLSLKIANVNTVFPRKIMLKLNLIKQYFRNK